MGNQSHIVRLAECLDFRVLRDTADIRQRHSGVVDSQEPILAHPRAAFKSLLIGSPNLLVRVDRRALQRGRRRGPEGSKSGVYASSRGFLQTPFLREGTGITLYMAERESAKQV